MAVRERVMFQAAGPMEGSHPFRPLRYVFSLSSVGFLHAHLADGILLSKLPEGRPIRYGNIDCRVALLLRARTAPFHRFTPSVRGPRVPRQLPILIMLPWN
ncbi:hypothetical protein SPHV1_560044 [Novosphingobium sp. KN65.2]|nr:hypothetical protein SPHV1_560044 [Novosphingobium sp. KN65.2]